MVHFSLGERESFCLWLFLLLYCFLIEHFHASNSFLKPAKRIERILVFNISIMPVVLGALIEKSFSMNSRSCSGWSGLGFTCHVITCIIIYLLLLAAILASTQFALFVEVECWVCFQSKFQAVNFTKVISISVETQLPNFVESELSYRA